MENQTQISLRVRYQETDQMGVVHHANYINWFEMGRTEWLREKGFDYVNVEKKGLLLPVIQVHCDYIKPAHYDDEVTIIATLGSYSGVRLSFQYNIYRNKDHLLKGHSMHCWTDTFFRPVSLKKKWPDLHQVLLNI